MEQKKIKTWKRLLVMLVVVAMLVQSMAVVWAEGDSQDITESAVQEQQTDSEGETEVDTASPEVTQEVTPEATAEVTSEAAEKENNKLTVPQDPEVQEQVIVEDTEDTVSAVGGTISGQNLSLADYLTEFTFTDENDIPFSDTNPVMVDSYIKIHYGFEFSNEDTIAAGTTFVLSLPDVFNLGTDYGNYMPLVTTSTGIDAEWRIDSSGVITLKFNEATTASNIAGYFNISAKVDRIKLTEETITFELGKNLGEATYAAEPEEEGDRGADIDKTGSLTTNNLGHTVSWTLTVTPKDTQTLAGLVLRERWDAEQMELVGVYMNSVSSSNQIADSELAMESDGGGFNYTFPETIGSGEQKLVVVTRLKDTVFLEDNDSTAPTSTTIPTIKNTAEIYNETSKEVKGTTDATIQQSVPKTKITKTQYSSSLENNTVTYRMGVNGDQRLDLSGGLTLIDTYPDGLQLKSTKIYVNSQDITTSGKDTKYSLVDNYSAKTVTFDIIKGAYLSTERYETIVYLEFEIEDITKFDFDEDTKQYVIPNKAEAYYSGEAYATINITGGVGPGFGTEYITVKKSHNILEYDVPEGESGTIQSEWIVKINNLKSVRNAKHTTIAFTDTLPTGQTYVPGTFKVNGAPVADADVMWGTDENGNQTIKYILTASDRENDECTVSFTVITDLSVASGTTIKNIAKVTSDGDEATSEDTMKIDEASRLAKSGSYDAETGIYTWTIKINSANSPMLLKDAIITEILPDGHVIVDSDGNEPGTIDQIIEKMVIYIRTSDDHWKSTMTLANKKEYFDFSLTDQTLTLTAKQDLPELYQIIVKTKLKDEAQSPSATNNVYMKADNLTELHASATCDVLHEIAVDKSTAYQSGGTLSWSVKLNWHEANEADTTVIEAGSKLTDTLPLNLEYVPGTLKLVRWKRSSTSTGVYSESTLIDSGEGNLEIDTAANRLTYTIPTDNTDFVKTGAYMLTFDTKVLWDTGTTANTCEFTNLTEKIIAESKEIILKDTGVSAGITGDNLSITINKTDENGDPLADAEFTLYDENHVKMESVTTESSGIVRFYEGLLFGHTYYIKETVVPAGKDQSAKNDEYKFVIGNGSSSSTSVEIVITKNDKELKTVTVNKDNTGFFPVSLDIINELQPAETPTPTPTETPTPTPIPKAGSLKIEKTVSGTAGEQDKDFTFTVTFKDAQGNEVADSFSYSGSKSGSITSGGTITLKHGESVTIVGLPEGTDYEVVESGNSGYTVTKDGEADTITDESISTAAFTNHKDSQDVSISKVDITGNIEVEGAFLTVYEKNQDGSKGTVIDAWTSDGIGAHTIEGSKLKAGQEYILEETYAAPGYTYAADIAFSLDNDGKVVIDSQYLDELGNVVMKDEPVVTAFKKTDVAGNEVSGATLTIYKKNADGSKGSDVVAQWISTDKAYEVKGILELETEYILEETSAPKGYAYANDISFRIEKDGSVVVIDGKMDDDGNIVMVDEVIELSVSKINSAGKELAGAILSVYETDENGKTIVIDEDGNMKVAVDMNGDELTWETTGEVYDITGLSPGTYVLHEEVVPWGYNVANDITFTVNEDGTITKVSEDGAIEGNKIIMTDLRYHEVMAEWIPLTVKKIVTGTGGDKEQYFTFTFTFTDEDGEELTESFPYEGSKSGTISSGGSVELKHGEQIHIGELPLGTNYVIVESNNEGYTVTETNTDGSIDEGTITAAFKNHKDSANLTPTPTPTSTPTSTPKAVTKANSTTKGSTAATSKTVKTGDTSVVWMWLIICLVCAVACGGAVVYRRRSIKK